MTPDTCACGMHMVRISPQPVFRCPGCGVTVRWYKKSWQIRSENASVATHTTKPVKHYAAPQVHRKFTERKAI